MSKRSIEDQLGHIATLGVRVRNAEVAVVDAKKELETARAGLQKAVLAGETTGDPVVDLVVRVGAHPDDPLLAEVRALDQALKGKKGEFALITFHDDVPNRHTFGKGYDTRGAQCYRLGVLSGEELIAGKDRFSSQETILFPIARYVEGEHTIITERSDLRSLKVVEHNLFSQNLGGFHEGNPPQLFSFLQGNWRESLIIGDEPVKEWLKKHVMPGLYKPAADALSKLILEPTDE